MKTVSASALRRMAALLLAVLLTVPVLALYPAQTAGKDPVLYEEQCVPTLRAGEPNSGLITDSEAYRYLLSEFMKCSVKVNSAGSTVCEVNISRFGLKEEDVMELFSMLFYSEAELFFLSGSYSYTRYTNSDVVQSVIAMVENGVDPSATGEEIQQFRQDTLSKLDEFHEITDAIIAEVNPAFSDWEKVAFIHDYVALHYGYDYDYGIYNAYDMVTKGTGVCQAYSLLTRYLLRKLGIACECVSCEGLNHEWNIVKLGGSWYHMDVTWDDWDDRGMYGQVSHAFFLASDSYFDAGENGDGGDGSHHSDSGWSSPVRATNGQFDGVFADVSTPFIFAPEAIYVINDGSLSTYDPETLDFTVLLTLNLTWRVSHGLFGLGGAKWNGIYAGLWYHNGRLYWNGDKKIYSYDPVTKDDPVVLYTYSDNNSHSFFGSSNSNLIFGLRAEADGNNVNFTLSLMSDPNTGNPLEQIQTINGYEITWNVAGITYKSVSLYGETPRFDGSLSIAPNFFSYAFLQWDRTLRPTKQDSTYVAMFKMTRNDEELTSYTLREQFRLLREAQRLLPYSNAGYLNAAEQAELLNDLLADYALEIEAYNTVFSGVLFGGN